jgi:hypothetical protein
VATLGDREAGGDQAVPGAVRDHTGPQGPRPIGDHADEQREADDRHGEGRQVGDVAVPAEQDQRDVDRGGGPAPADDVEEASREATS